MKVPLLHLLPVLAFALPGFAQRITTAPLPAPDAVFSAISDGSSSSAVYRVAPPEKRTPHLHLLDWSGLGAAATLRYLDYRTTEEGLAHPQYVHESQLPRALVGNKPAFAAFEAGTVAVNYGAYRLLVRHNLRTIARISQYVYLGIMSGQVASNYEVLGNVP